MKNIRYIIPILVFFLTVNAYSQRRSKYDPDKIRAYKIAYITDKLSLTEKEAEKFWPIYNAHEKRMSELRKEESTKIWKMIRSKEEITDLSEADAKSVITSMMTIQDKVHKASREYAKKLKSIFSYKKILQLKVAERGFKRELFEKLRKQRKRVKKE